MQLIKRAILLVFLLISFSLIYCEDKDCGENTTGCDRLSMDSKSYEKSFQNFQQMEFDMFDQLENRNSRILANYKLSDEVDNLEEIVRIYQNTFLAADVKSLIAKLEDPKDKAAAEKHYKIMLENIDQLKKNKAEIDKESDKEDYEIKNALEESRKHENLAKIAKENEDTIEVLVKSSPTRGNSRASWHSESYYRPRPVTTPTVTPTPTPTVTPTPTPTVPEPVPNAISLNTISATSSACMQGFLDVVPPSFCWKNADWGFIPKGCPEGYFRYLALCYEYCRPGYNFVASVCWSGCDPGYKNHPASCYKNLFRCDRVPCPTGHYKMGALCYRDCMKIGLENCGIGACAASRSGCIGAIVEMVIESIVFVAQAIMTVVTFGGATVASQGIKNLKGAVANLGKGGIKAAFSKVKSIFTRLTTQGIKDLVIKAKDKAKKFLIDGIKSSVTDFFIESICSTVAEGMINQTKEKSEPNFMDVVETFDFTGIVGAVKTCSNINESGALNCAKDVMKSVANVDPTGLVSLAATFMHPSCGNEV